MSAERVSIVHIETEGDAKVNEETGQEVYPYDLTKEEWLQFLLNHSSSIIINTMEMLEAGYPPQAILGTMLHSAEDEEYKQQVLKVTKMGLSGDMSDFDKVDGKSPAAAANDNVVDFPGNKRTIH